LHLFVQAAIPMTDLSSDKTYKLVFIIQAYESADPLGNLSDSCQLELFADTYVDALKKAKLIIKKKFYRLSKVIEYDTKGI
jgi:hypothetical protein